MKCIYCQKDIMDNSNMCPNCGSIQPKKGNNKPIIIIGIIIIALLLTIISYLILNNNNDNSNNSDNNNYNTSNNEESDRYEEENDSEIENEKENEKEDIDDEEDDIIIDKPSNTKSEIKVYEFYGATCSYCMALNSWFDSIEDEYGMYYELVKLEVWYNQENSELMNDVGEYLKIDVSGVPFVVIGDKYTLGFSESTTPNIIINYIMDEYNKAESERIDVIEKVKDR